MSSKKDRQFEFDLIQAVRERSFLYDHNNPKNKDIASKAIAWKEISKICGEPAERCLARWKSLRDRYLREWKIKRDTNKKVKWSYFNSLKFLDKHLKTINPIMKSDEQEPEASTSSANIDESIDQIEHNDSDSFIDNFIIKPKIKKEITKPSNSTTNNKTSKSTSLLKIEPRFEKNRQIKTDTEDNVNIIIGTDMIMSGDDACGSGGSGNDNNSHHNNNNNHKNMMLDEPEIDFDVIGVTNRLHDTIKSYKEVMSLRLDRTEDENFGALVADMLSILTVDRRIRAKAHLVQYLADLHLKQIRNS